MTLKEFEQKYKGEDFDNMSFEDMFFMKQDAFDMYETEGFTDTFQSPYEEYKEHNGKKFEVVRRASYVNGDCDMECLPMWFIRFDGETNEYIGYPEEICKLEMTQRQLEENCHFGTIIAI